MKYFYSYLFTRLFGNQSAERRLPLFERVFIFFMEWVLIRLIFLMSGLILFNIVCDYVSFYGFPF